MTRTWEHPRKGYQCCHDWLERMQIGLVGVPGDPGTVGRRPSSYSSGYPPRKPPLARSLEWAIIENYGKARRSNKKARQVQQCLGGLMRYFHPDSESELRWILLISLDIFGSYICIWKLLPNCIFFRTGKTNRTVKLHTFGCLVQKFGNYSLFFFWGWVGASSWPPGPQSPSISAWLGSAAIGGQYLDMVLSWDALMWIRWISSSDRNGEKNTRIWRLICTWSCFPGVFFVCFVSCFVFFLEQV